MDIGLYYYNARYYAPTLARFLSPDTLIPDPANPQSFNRYSYVENRPLNFNDPTGHIACETLGTEECNDDGEFVDSPVQKNTQQIINIFLETVTININASGTGLNMLVAELSWWNEVSGAITSADEAISVGGAVVDLVRWIRSSPVKGGTPHPITPLLLISLQTIDWTASDLNALLNELEPLQASGDVASIQIQHLYGMTGIGGQQR